MNSAHGYTEGSDMYQTRLPRKLKKKRKKVKAVFDILSKAFGVGANRMRQYQKWMSQVNKNLFKIV